MRDGRQELQAEGMNKRHKLTGGGSVLRKLQASEHGLGNGV